MHKSVIVPKPEECDKMRGSSSVLMGLLFFSILPMIFFNVGRAAESTNEITCYVSPSCVALGENVLVYGYCPAGAAVSLQFARPDKSIFYRETYSNGSGSYESDLISDQVGQWSVTASLQEGPADSATFVVRENIPTVSLTQYPTTGQVMEHEREYYFQWDSHGTIVIKLDLRRKVVAVEAMQGTFEEKLDFTAKVFSTAQFLAIELLREWDNTTRRMTESEVSGTFYRKLFITNGTVIEWLAGSSDFSMASVVVGTGVAETPEWVMTVISIAIAGETSQLAFASPGSLTELPLRIISTPIGSLQCKMKQEGNVEYFYEQNSGILASYTSEWSGDYFGNYTGRDREILSNTWIEAPEVQTYFPHFVFDEGEKFYPTDFLYDDGTIENNPSEYNFTWPTCVYVHTVEGSYEEYLGGPKEDFLVIEYWLYYVRDSKAFNHEVPVIGAHDHDWESVYVFLKKSGGKFIPSYATYFRHRTLLVPDYFATVAWSGIQIVGSTHPVVHVARDSHASYEKTIWGFGIFVYPAGLTGIPLPEPCDGGLELDCNDFRVAYVDYPSQTWPAKFGGIDPPWDRSRWSNPGYLLQLREEASFSLVGINDPQGRLYLHAYDSLQRHTGYAYSTGQIEQQIPDSYYIELENASFISLPSNVTEFQIQVDSIAAEYPVENYEFAVCAVKEDGVFDQFIANNTIMRGSTSQFDVKLDSSGKIVQIPEFSSLVFVLSLTIPVTFAAIFACRRKPS